MADLVRGVLSLHVRKLVVVEHRKENENVIALHHQQVEKVVLAQLLKLKIVMPIAAQVNMSGSWIFRNERVTTFLLNSIPNYHSLI